jgi:peptide/nickel transport system permease protein
VSRYFIRRALLIFPQLFFLSIVVFSIIYAAPGDPVITRVGMAATEEQIERVTEALGLDKPIHEQYWLWLRQILHFEFGRSFITDQPVAEIIGVRLGPTLLLTCMAQAISLTLGILLGILASRWRNTLLDYAVTAFSFFFVAIPDFWASIIAIIVFCVILRWFPSIGMRTVGQPTTPLDVLKHLTLPACVLGLGGMATIARYVRSSMIEVMTEDYIRTAWAKGLSESVVLVRHALRNALLPVATIVGMRLPKLVGGAILVEIVFSWPGLGSATVEAAFQRDYPVCMAMALMGGFITILGNLAVDLSYGVLDPRIRSV